MIYSFGHAAQLARPKSRTVYERRLVAPLPGGFMSLPVHAQTVQTRPDYRIKPREFVVHPGFPEPPKSRGIHRCARYRPHIPHGGQGLPSIPSNKHDLLVVRMSLGLSGSDG